MKLRLGGRNPDGSGRVNSPPEAEVAHALREALRDPILMAQLRQEYADTFPFFDLLRFSDQEIIDRITHHFPDGRLSIFDLEDPFGDFKGSGGSGKKPAPKPPPETPVNPLIPPRQAHWIKIVVIDDDTNAVVSGAVFHIELPSGIKTQLSTNAGGEVEIRNIDPGSCTLTGQRKLAQLKNSVDFVRVSSDRGAVAADPAAASALSGSKIIEITDYKVKTGDSLDLLAQANNFTWQELTKFNWETADPDTINIHLHDDVGCTKKTKDKKNFVFDSADKPGVIFIPSDWSCEGLATDRTHYVRVRRPAFGQIEAPKIDMKWSKDEVTPDHNQVWPPANPPLDTIPEEAQVEMLVTTTNVPEGTKTTITIHHCKTDALVPDGTFDDLVVEGDSVVDPNTHKPPVFVFNAKQLPWEIWNEPFFYFKATVDYKGLNGQTSKNFKGERAMVLRVLYWHACVADVRADTNDGLTTKAEADEIAALLLKNPNHKLVVQTFQNETMTTALWGSVVRNTYVYHQASHGTIRNRTTGARKTSKKNPPDDESKAAFESVMLLIGTRFRAAEVNSVADVPSVPRYLVYMDTCLAGWEPGFGNAFLARGTKYFLGFRMTIPDGDARQMARDFYKKWAGTHKCDPTKIPAVFFDVGAPYYGSMRPMLLGTGGGEIKPPDSLLTKAKKFLEGIIDDIVSIFREPD